jgi:hypothetical protein
VTGRAGHAPRTKLEAFICKEMSRQGLVHEHRSLRFRVRDAAGGKARYSPAIVARRGRILFLVEPVATMTRSTIERLTGFLDQHSPEIVLVVVAPDAKVRKVPQGAYDEIYPESEIARMTQRIRDQDPEGIVRPFEKPRPAG